ncbi:TPA: hypothetical protein R4B11_004018 [Salmonella enterica subsp. enterica serovar Potsdam]|nr:hypothetical protein [Salmonella enterica]HEC8061812.1 hypothetical protein [Salmonella enterica subsp. enterica serovar Potsdam]
MNYIMRKIYIYGENPQVISVLREVIKDLMNSQERTEYADGTAYGYSGVIQDAEELLERIRKSIKPPVVMLNIQPGRHVLLLQAIREIRTGVAIAVFSPEILYPDRIVSRCFNCTLHPDTDVAGLNMARCIETTLLKGELKYRMLTSGVRKEFLIPELTRRMDRTIKELDYILHISLLSESLTRKERTLLSHLREGRSVRQTASLTRAGHYTVGIWYKNLCERLTLQYHPKDLAENFILSPDRQINPFRENITDGQEKNERPRIRRA